METKISVLSTVMAAPAITIRVLALCVYALPPGMYRSNTQATPDYILNKTILQNNSIEYAFTFTQAKHSVTVLQSEKLYFIDTNPVDDGLHDTSSGDDGYAIVNATGCAVKIAYPLANA